MLCLDNARLETTQFENARELLESSEFVLKQ